MELGLPEGWQQFQRRKTSPDSVIEEAMSSTTIDSEGCTTPTSSDTCDNSEKPTLTRRYLDCPWKGRTFIIRDSVTHLVIGLQKGNVELVPDYHKQWCGVYWTCVESEKMVLGFQNVISGTFLGQESWSQGPVIADTKYHESSEAFCVRQHPSGGHFILKKRGDGFLPMRIGPDNTLQVGPNRDEGTIWEFIRVDNNV
ncbi:hypothetical protein N7504_004571 [Penicillium tannophilum]|nr:hypothetical protein N7504_004571 [Penicillium tannophilum]